MLLCLYLVNVKFGHTPLSLGLLVPGEAAGDDGEHLVLGDEPALVGVELGELLPDLGLGLPAAVQCVPQLCKLGLVDALVAILVRLQQKKLGFCWHIFYDGQNICSTVGNLVMG